MVLAGDCKGTARGGGSGTGTGRLGTVALMLGCPALLAFGAAWASQPQQRRPARVIAFAAAPESAPLAGAQPAVAPKSVEEVLAAGVPPSSASAIASLTTAIGCQGCEPLCDPLTLLRFYNARDQDVEAAAAMHAETVAWRAEYSIHDIMSAFGDAGEYTKDGARATDVASWNWRRNPSSPEAREAIRFAFFGRLRATGSDGAPILVWRAGVADYAGFVREGLVDLLTKAWVVHIEDALQAARAASLQSGRLVRARLVVDARGFGLSSLRYLPILRQIISLGKANFPEVTASITVIRAPSAIATLYRLVKPLLTPLMQAKICILGNDFQAGLKEHAELDLHMLPPSLGGSRDDCNESDLGGAEAVPVGAGASLNGLK